MPWIIEYVHDWWWTYDPSDGQLLYNDGEDYVHIEYVSTGWKEASEAVAEYFEDFYSYSEESSQEDSDEEESNEEGSDEDDNGNDISDDDDTTEEDTTDEDTTDEDTTDEDEEEEEAYNPYENPYKYRLFNTRNPNGYCVGLSLYWAKERLTTGYSLTDSMPDYSEAEETHLWFRTMTKKLNFPDTLNVLLEDDPWSSTMKSLQVKTLSITLWMLCVRVKVHICFATTTSGDLSGMRWRSIERGRKWGILTRMLVFLTSRQMRSCASWCGTR